MASLSLLDLPGGVLGKLLCHVDADALVAFACASSSAAGVVRGQRPFVQAHRAAGAAERTRVLAESMRLFSTRSADETESVTFEFNSNHRSWDLVSHPYLVALFIQRDIKPTYNSMPFLSLCDHRDYNPISTLSAPTIRAMMEDGKNEVDILPHTLGSYLPLAGHRIIVNVNGVSDCRVRAVFSWTAPPAPMERCITVLNDRHMGARDRVTLFSLGDFRRLSTIALCVRGSSLGECLKGLGVMVTRAAAGSSDVYAVIDDDALEDVTVRIGAREATFRAQDIRARRWGGRFGFRRGYLLPVVPTVEAALFETLSLKLRAKEGVDISKHYVTIVLVKGNCCLRVGSKGRLGLSHLSESL